jgi:exosortase
LFASEAATYAAQAVGVSIYRQGNIIQLANTSLGVAEACSGLQSLSALLVASLLVGFVENGSMLGRVLLFLLAAPLAISVNVLRITGTAILADYRLEFALGFYHSFSGWLVFIVGFGGLWLLGKAIFRLTGRRA